MTIDTVKCDLNLTRNIVRVFQGEGIVAYVGGGKDGKEPELMLLGGRETIIVRLSELMIILDNWNQLQEQRAESQSS